MIVPQSRLLFWFAIVVLPFAVLGAVYAEALPLAIVAIAVLAVLAALDVALGLGGLDGISVKLPEVLRFSKDREGAIEVRLRNERQKPRRLRLGLAFPCGIRSAVEDTPVALPAGSEWSRLEWPCTPLQRGNFRLSRAYLETASPLGFWAVRAMTSVNAEMRVYPNLFTERKNLAALFLNRGAFGIHAQRQVGKGRDFEKLREYVPGDSFDDIHWKATAKRGRPVTKVFQIERTQEVYVVVDASRLSAREAVQSSKFKVQSSGPALDGSQLGTLHLEPGTSILERYVTAALVLGLAAEQQGDLFGLATFSDKVETFVRARNGKAHYSACRDAIYALEPRLVTPDFEEIASFLRLRLRRRALLIFLTALDDPALAESFVRAAELLGHQHLLLVNMMKPPGAEPLFSQPGVESVDDLYQHLGGHLRWHSLRELEKVLQRRGVQFALLENEKLSVQLVSQYLGVKQRQLL
ncbi:MAG: DUF58 domain-containing protein [Verrucomicrobia bacterium]|nr:DUF58 domain-containing protein [Verrucomicrobiota bacterium]